MAAWRELDRPTRRDLLRRTGPHPDPMVGCVAVGYARTMLARRWRGRSPLAMAALCAGLGLTLLASAVAAAALPAGPRSVVFPVIVFVGIVAVVFLSLVPTMRFRLQLIRMENVNAAALLTAESPAPAPRRTAPGVPEPGLPGPMTSDAPVAGVPGPVPPGAPGGTVVVAHDRRTVLGQQAKVAAITLVIAATVLLHPQWQTVPVLALCVLAWALIIRFLVRWVLPRRPVLLLDADGVRAGSGVALPWQDVTEIRVLPLRLRSRATPRHRVVAFVCADPQRVIDGLGGMRGRGARQALEFYGSPLAVATHTLDHTAEQIAAASRGLHPVPVRSFGA